MPFWGIIMYPAWVLTPISSHGITIARLRAHFYRKLLINKFRMFA
ncbi:MAG: hypothetical protein ACFE96_11130 [Candidatus Hermodarchaeota archaeon]